MKKEIKFDYSKLKGLMKEKGYTQADLGKTIGISEVSLRSKLNGKRYFTSNEIYQISNVLEIARVSDYFFKL